MRVIILCSLVYTTYVFCVFFFFYSFPRYHYYRPSEPCEIPLPRYWFQYDRRERCVLSDWCSRVCATWIFLPSKSTLSPDRGCPVCTTHVYRVDCESNQNTVHTWRLIFFDHNNIHEKSSKCASKNAVICYKMCIYFSTCTIDNESNTFYLKLRM